MKKAMSLAAVFVFALATTANACDGAKRGDKATLTGAKVACHPPTKAGCPGKAAKDAVAKVMKLMPTMTYKVGDFTTCCDKSAASKAEETGTPLEYVVAGKTFKTEQQANAALAEALEAEIARLKTIRYEAGGKHFGCPKAAASVAESHNGKVRYQLAGFSFDSMDKAEAAAKAVADAVAGTPVTDAAQPTAAAGKTGCRPGCGATKAVTTSLKGAKTGCGHDKAHAAAGKDGKPACCAKKKAQTAGAKSDTAAGDSAKAQTASASGYKGTPASCAGKDPSKCCPKARIATAHKKVQVIVEAAAAVYAS